MSSNNGIAKAKGTESLLVRGGNTDDIIGAILDTITDVRAQTAMFSQQFAPTERGLGKLWWWVKSQITYIEDPLGVQWVREPARLYADRQGDCKSFTVFIASVLENLGIKYLVRFVNTDRRNSKIVNHVYPVALLNGREIIMDAVYDYFDREHPYYNKRDYSMSQIYRLAGIGSTSTNTLAEISEYNDKVLAIANSIEDDVLVNDITEMSQGQYARYMSHANFSALSENAANAADSARYAAAAQAINTGSIAGIGNLGGDAAKIQAFLDHTSTQHGKAFSAPIIEVPEGIGSLGERARNLAANVLNAWKKVVNWMFKKALPIAAPFFLYTFIKSKLKGRSAKKRDKQMATLRWVEKTGKFDTPDAVVGAIKLGISKTFGQPVEKVLKGMARGKGIGRVGVLPVVGLIASSLPALLEMVQKIGSLFKKNDAPPVTADDAPNPDELYQDIDEGEKQTMTVTPPTKSERTSNAIMTYISDNPGMALGGLVLVAGVVYWFNNKR